MSAVTPNKCPRCGTPLPANTTHKVCARCALADVQAFAEQESSSQRPDLQGVRDTGQSHFAGDYKPGDTIGRYDLREKIGEGGSGVVFLAEQQQPFKRQVALKIIKRGMDNDKVISRFQTELRALALLDHSSIARIYDAGTTHERLPFFTMELVRGKKITEYCDSHRLTVPQRLELFVKVCRAVQHAHEKSFIHRDIKPSNVLVTEENGEPFPKLIDFGIAKTPTGEQLTNNAVNTATGQILGTLAYMSPEQARGQDIDNRTDVYSLGGLLYELMVGCLPLELDGLGQYEQFRTIIEVRPTQLTDRFEELPLKDKLKITHCRQTQIDLFPNQLHSELDGIVMKCLEKNRERRFQAASDLTARIQQYLKAQMNAESQKESVLAGETKLSRKMLIIIKTIVEPFWLADSLILSASERGRIARSKWYKTIEGIGAKLFLLILPGECLNAIYKREYPVAIGLLFVVCAYTYVAFLLRKFRKQDVAPQPPPIEITPLKWHEHLMVYGMMFTAIGIYLLLIHLMGTRNILGIIYLVGAFLTLYAALWISGQRQLFLSLATIIICQ